MLFLSYIEYLKTPDKKILSFWNTKFKPFLKINYPIIKNGIFVNNADFDFIMKEIDKYNQEPNEESLIDDEMKKKINEINKNKENNTNSNKPSIMPIKNENLNIKSILRPHSETIASTSTCDSYAYENASNFLKEKAEIKKSVIYNNKADNNTIIEIIDEQKNVNTDINDNNINSNNENNKNSSNEDNKNTSNEENKNTSNEDNNPKIDKESNNNNPNINKENNNNIKIINENNNNIIIEKDDIIKRKNKIMNNNINIDDILGQKSKSEILYKEMNQTFIDKEECATKNIIYQPLQKTKIKLIDANLLLKKIVENDFNKKNSKILYAFIRQSFSFLKKDIFIKKIINCYKHYIKINIPLNKIENLIYFLNVYIIEMYLYYKSIPKDDKLINLLVSFYNELITKVIKSINFENINKDSNIINKKEILNKKLCIKTTKIGKDSKDKVIKYYSNNFIRKKLHNMVDKNHAKLVQLKKEEKKLKKIRNSQKIGDDSIHNIKLDILEEEEKGGNTHYCENSLNFTHTINPDKKERSPQNEIIIDKNINDKSRNNSFKYSRKKSEEKGVKSLMNDKELIGIIGEEHKDIIKNNQLVSTEERLLLNLKNILILLNTKTYNEPEIIKMKNNEIFYESFNFYEGKENDNISHKKKQKNQDNNALYFTKSMTLIPRNFKLDYSKLNIAQNKSKRCFIVTDWETSQIGDQLINISKKALYKIECKELYGAIFTKNKKEINCPNLTDSIKKFNSLITFVIEDILSYDFPNDRARMMEKWALIAQYCKNKKDQSDCCAINSALNHYIITGLKLTLKCLKNKTKLIMNELNEYCKLEGNYKILREEIKNIKKNEFFIPYLGALLRDLTFFEESGKYLIQGNMINFEKIENVQNSLDLFFKCKNSDNKVDDKQIEELKFFEFLEDKTEEELEKIANQLEPVFKIRNIQQRDKRITEIDKKYFINESKSSTCIPNSKTVAFPNV